MKIAVIGAGSWGTAMAVMLGQKHDSVALWARNEALAEQMNDNRCNERYLPGVSIPPGVMTTSQLPAALLGAELVVLATPSQAVRETVNRISSYVSDTAIIVTATKGFELSSGLRMSEVIAEAAPRLKNRIAVLSGPNHAEEVGRAQPSATVVASNHPPVAEQVQDAFMLPYFRVYTNPDMIGVELGGALKNIIALGAGIAEGLEFGDNTKAALMTRGLAEIARLGVAMGADPLTFAGLSGIGDLMVTCTSRHSRNRRAGILLAQGQAADQIALGTNMVVEGIRTTAAAYGLAEKYRVEMPITEQIYQVIYAEKSPREAVLDLMTRGRTQEAEEVVNDQAIWKSPGNK
ncbi:glycerol 3-phosphate dehydrogenase (NAD(P)+) [Dendrosporobacter quercicolus]|uniref:Glycerol-3-phosphate dehydrogenase [NAD(P)+] n=1 Tax=Dendrosporobacter quercicolus TaxID=146817 RepID=A0A1G9L5L7_9FIRM|nr:NAD(P)H-dependent glycerol-3-phosphate dehydrogenase [Dendrosporobacter quercicolus]SDL56875.1 glycerol 3-phosphate dehydrogenase (NAD(P)+) [Dendrosporobacter quercicolus]